MERLLRDTHALARRWWDPGLRLLTHPGGLLDGTRVAAGEQGLLAPTVWWAHGLLRRGQAGDRQLAATAVRGVLARWGDERDDVQDADDRIAIGTALALVLRDHDLPAGLAADLRAAVEPAVRTMRSDGSNQEVDATSTTVAVHQAWLEMEVGRWSGDEDLLASGAELARSVAADSGTRGHVAEHVGPTCTGLTLLGLSLWAERPPVDDLAPLGRALRDEVWHDLLAVWHPGLGTLVPPFSRAHAMDLRAHLGATALWLAWLVDGVHPLPPLYEGDLDHGHDLPLAFLVDALADASDDVRQLAPLVRAQPARQGEWFDRVGRRVWTGWTGGSLAVGAEWSPIDRDGCWQMVPAAAVWRVSEDVDGGRNAWLRLQQRSGAVDARVEDAAGTVRLVHGTEVAPVELWVGGGQPDQATAARLVHGGRTWRLEGVAELAAVDCDVPHVTAAWELVPRADGVVLSTEV
ncbi:MAG: hypothetical protein U5L08_06130 [Xanthomonadales bacterium]|nr:hypothetical protein [Xanthomonadales bacterium]